MVTTFLIGGTIAFGLPARAYYRVAKSVDAQVHVLTIPRLGLLDMTGAMERLEQSILQQAHPDEPIEIIGHSQGGVLAAWIGSRHTDVVDRVVSVYGPFRGSRITPQHGAPICKYLKCDSPLLHAISTEVGEILGGRFTSIFSTNDRIAAPFQTGYVDGARNVLYTSDELFEEHAPVLPGVLHLQTHRPPGHLDIGRKKLLQAVCAALGHDVEDPVRTPVIPAQRRPRKRAAVSASP